MPAPWTELLPAVGLAIGLAACAGLRAWLPLLLAGGLARVGWLDVGPSFAFIASDRALLIFGVATVVEIAADKVPAVDHVLDALSTVLRPAAASLLAASVFGDFTDPLTAWVAGVAIGAPTALVPHAAKSLLRAASSTFTLGLANPVISVLEDLFAVALFLVAVIVPILAAVGVLVVAFLVLRRLGRRAPSAAVPAS
ncbi:MAG TPA: DUF4126 domain-containing protein [Vicinamibacteria bacterium]|jgi:hypothetical protein